MIEKSVSFPVKRQPEFISSSHPDNTLMRF